MTWPDTDVLNLVPEVLQLQMVITKGGSWTLGLNVTNSAGVGLDLTGTTAKITLPDGTIWTATISGSQYVWDITTAAVSALTFTSGTAILTVTNASRTAVWAKGKVTVN